MDRKLVLILVSLSFILSPIYIYSSIIYTQENVNTFSPDIAVVLGSGTAGSSTISTNRTSANVSLAAPVWLSGWDKRVRITIDNNDVDDAMSNFPVLVYLGNSSGRNNDYVSFVFDELQSDANRKKIAVTTSDGVAQCYVEIEKWDDANEQAWLWVKVPSVSNTSDTDLYLYYDKDQTDNTAYVGDPNSTSAENVWDTNYILVWHLSEEGDVIDSTSNNNDGTVTGLTSVVGKIGYAKNSSGGSNGIESLNTITLGIDQFTVEGWFNPNVYTTDWIALFGLKHPTNDYNEIMWPYTGNWGYWDASPVAVTSNQPIVAGQWDNYVVVREGTGSNQLKNYINGSYDNAGTTAYDFTSQLVWLGKSSTYPWNGISDELRISNISRSAAWIKACYESERDDLLDFGSEEGSIINNVDNNTSDVDSSADKGTHSNFTAQRYGPDSAYDTLTEENMGGEGTNPKYAVTASTSEITGAPDGSYAIVGKGGTCEVTDYEGGTGTIQQVYFNITYYGTVSGTLAWAYQLDGGGYTNIEDLPEGGSATSPLTRTYNATSLRASWTWDNLNTTDIQFQNNDDKGPEDAYIDAIYVTVVTSPPNYELDLEVQWTNANYTKTNEELCIRTGTTDAENIQVDVRNGSSWVNLFTNLTANSWNNISVTDYLTSSTFTIRFKGGSETGDTSEDSWNIDVTLLHVSGATYDYILSVSSQKTYDQNIRLSLYNYTNIDRLSNCTIWFRDGTTSFQINITSGVVIQDVGPWYLLPASETRYIVVYVEESTSGTSVLFIKLEAVKASSIVYTCLIELTVN